MNDDLLMEYAEALERVDLDKLDRIFTIAKENCGLLIAMDVLHIRDKDECSMPELLIAIRKAH